MDDDASERSRSRCRRRDGKQCKYSRGRLNQGSFVDALREHIFCSRSVLSIDHFLGDDCGSDPDRSTCIQVNLEFSNHATAMTISDASPRSAKTLRNEKPQRRHHCLPHVVVLLGKVTTERGEEIKWIAGL